MYIPVPIVSCRLGKEPQADMAKTRKEETSVERVVVDEPRLRALMKALGEALHLPEGTSLYEAFQEVPGLEERQETVDRGIYLFRPAEATVSLEAARTVFEKLLNCFRDHMDDRKQEWDALEKGASTHPSDLTGLLSDILANKARRVLELAGSWGVSPDTISLLALFWARPFRTEAARRLLEGVSLTSWRNGFCPTCGHWPALGYLAEDEGQRTLWCGACGTPWRFPRLLCPFCLNSDMEKLPYITVDDDQSRPVYLCEECKRYLKHRREKKDAERDGDIEYLLSAPLDYVAVSQGYIQESLISVRFDEPDGEAVKAYRAKASYQESPEGLDKIH